MAYCWEMNFRNFRRPFNDIFIYSWDLYLRYIEKKSAKSAADVAGSKMFTRKLLKLKWTHVRWFRSKVNHQRRIKSQRSWCFFFLRKSSFSQENFLITPIICHHVTFDFQVPQLENIWNFSTKIFFDLAIKLSQKIAFICIIWSSMNNPSTIKPVDLHQPRLTNPFRKRVG